MKIDPGQRAKLFAGLVSQAGASPDQAEQTLDLAERAIGAALTALAETCAGHPLPIGGNALGFALQLIGPVAAGAFVHQAQIAAGHGATPGLIDLGETVQ